MTTIANMLEQDFGTLPALIHAHATERPGHPVLVQDGHSVSYAELDALMDRVAASLQRDGLQPRDAIAICAGTSIDYAVLFLGALRAGVAVAPLAPSSTADSLAVMIEDSGARLLLLQASHSSGNDVIQSQSLKDDGSQA